MGSFDRREQNRVVLNADAVTKMCGVQERYMLLYVERAREESCVHTGVICRRGKERVAKFRLGVWKLRGARGGAGKEYTFYEGKRRMMYTCLLLKCMEMHRWREKSCKING
jgi:hypothetical protein